MDSQRGYRGIHLLGLKPVGSQLMPNAQFLLLIALDPSM